MEDPYSTPSSCEKRVFKTPLIAPISVILVIVVYVGYSLYHGLSDNTEHLSVLKNISFELFLFCEFGIISLIIYNKIHLDKYLSTYPTIASQESLNELKPIARTNMYSSLLTLFFLLVGSLTAIVTILNHGIIKAVIVAVLSIIAGKIMKWYNASEHKIKNIACSNETLNNELESILNCWIHKAFPNF